VSVAGPDTLEAELGAWLTECLGPVSGEPLDMLGVEAVAERMADNVVGHHPTMPGIGKTAQAVLATRRLKDSLHGSMMTIGPTACKGIAGGSAGGKWGGRKSRPRTGV